MSSTTSSLTGRFHNRAPRNSEVLYGGNPAADVDAYQLGHFLMIPDGMNDFQLSQLMHRKPLAFPGEATPDPRLMSYGLNLWVEAILKRRLTKEGVEQLDWLLEDFHTAPNPPIFGKPYPFPKDMLMRVVNDYDGYWPVVVTGLLDGTTHRVGIPNAQIWTDQPGMGECVGWLESALARFIWPSTVVATRGRKRKQRMERMIREIHPDITDQELMTFLEYMFHDFGARGCIDPHRTGTAHLLNYLGTDTIVALLTAVMHLNDGKKFGARSILAAAHRTVTPHETELAAIKKTIEASKGYFFSFVIDSYGSEKCLQKLAEFSDIIKHNGSYLVCRPDSGDIVEWVIRSLTVMCEAFGETYRNGLRRPIGAGVIQGDGVSDDTLFGRLYPEVIAAGFDPLCLAVGMGGHNHDCRRSDIETAYKTALVLRSNGDYGFVMKGSEMPLKRSIPGPVGVDLAGRYQVYPITIEDLKAGNTGDLVCLYNGIPDSPIEPVWSTFDEARVRAYKTWDQFPVHSEDFFDPRIRKLQFVIMNEMANAA